jgi:hypothetical protein
MTRARNDLAVVYPLNAYHSRRGADYSMDQLSRFIDRGVRDKMQRVATGEEPVAASTAAAGRPLIDLRALMRGKFKP